MATLIGLTRGTTSISISYTEGGTTKSASVSTFTVIGEDGSAGTVVNPDPQTYKTSGTYTFQLGITDATGTVTYPTSITVKQNGTTLSVSNWTCTSAGVLSVTAGSGTGKDAGTYTVTGNVSVAGTDTYEPVTASKTWTIVIDKASSTLTLSRTNATYPSKGNIKGSASVTGTIYYGSSSNTMTSTKSAATANTNYTLISSNTIGTTTIYGYLQPSSTNYNNSATVSKSFTVSKGTLTVNVSPLNGTYTGSPQNTIVSVATTNQAGTTVSPAMTYCLTSNGTYSSTIPQLTNATTGTSVYWKAVLSGYNDASGAVTAVIGKAANIVTYAVSASSVWCGTDASARSTTDAAKTVNIATSSASATAGSITYAVSVKNSSNTTVNGWSVSTDGKTVTTSAATAAGVYTVSVTATASSTTNYSSGTKTVSSTVTVSAVSLSSITLTLKATTVSCNTSTSVSSVIAHYNNSASKNITTSIGSSSTANPRVYSSDTTIATVLVS